MHTIIKVSNAVRDTERERTYQTILCRKARLRKRKCYLLLCNILSFQITFPFDPVTCCFLLKQHFEIERSQAFFSLIGLTGAVLQIECSPPLLLSLF